MCSVLSYNNLPYKVSLPAGHATFYTCHCCHWWNYTGITALSGELSLRGLEPVSYRGALLSSLLHALYTFFLHNFLNVLIQIISKIGLQKKKTAKVKQKVTPST
jgi:hypothetical protein